ncbi:hypothetical protein OKA04_10455 [Luteolibacter flavescens]|uniref:DUF2029 domain-containing protein n=1 Tax=Luteolibacter flavescens TaxID=1859460 RepID=A0ABT3FP79_9BACT|nr:hypothetical protein [Luteolibacter flavescens]MCW1885149.1 hypothetical protein [Luteolibacter flavescens]
MKDDGIDATVTRQRGGWKWWLLAIPAILLFAIALQVSGQVRVFGAWGLNVHTPDFEDARSITSAIESVREGIDPTVANPRDPWGRPFNYPLVWLALGEFGFDQSRTGELALWLTASLFLGFLVFPGRRTGWFPAICLLLVMMSPAVMMGVKAGNIDQFMFFLVALGIVGISHSRGAAQVAGVSAIVAAFVLKMFPAFGLAAILGFRKRLCLWLCAILVLGTGIYGWTQLGELQRIKSTTPVGIAASYGRDVTALRVAEELPHLANAARIGSHAMTAVGIGLLALGAFTGKREGIGADARAITAFRAGAMIYCGTFLLGSNWDYRLMFLAFTIPLLAAMCRQASPVVKWSSLLMLACILASCWSIGIWGVLRGIPHGSQASVVIDEGANWAVFLGLMFLFGRTLPAWLAIPSRKATQG